MCLICISVEGAATAAVALTGWRYYHAQLVAFFSRLRSIYTRAF